jgi:hypothetical protein
MFFLIILFMLSNEKIENIKLIIKKKNIIDETSSFNIYNITSNILVIPKIIELKNIFYIISNKLIVILIIIVIIYIIYRIINILKEKLI